MDTAKLSQSSWWLPSANDVGFAYYLRVMVGIVASENRILQMMTFARPDRMHPPKGAMQKTEPEYLLNLANVHLITHGHNQPYEQSI